MLEEEEEEEVSLLAGGQEEEDCFMMEEEDNVTMVPEGDKRLITPSIRKLPKEFAW